jgi:hypothetical protein
MCERDDKPPKVHSGSDSDPGGRRLEMKHIRNERIKLLANNIDRASSAVLTLGVASPIVGIIFQVNGFGQNVALWQLGLAVLGFLGTAAGIHFAARSVLRDLEP